MSIGVSRIQPPPTALNGAAPSVGGPVAPEVLRRFEQAVRTAALPLPAARPRDAPGGGALPAAGADKPGRAEQDMRSASSEHGLPDAAMLLLPSLLLPPAPVAAPAPGAVDPGVFADMMDQLWLREQNRQTREIKVKFGDDAWPATGASVLRLEDGGLSITVGMAPHGHPGDIEQLQQQLADRGLPVRNVMFVTES